MDEIKDTLKFVAIMATAICSVAFLTWLIKVLGVR